MASDFSLRHDLAERNSKCPNRAFCSYRLLGDVKSVYIFNMVYLHLLSHHLKQK